MLALIWPTLHLCYLNLKSKSLMVAQLELGSLHGLTAYRTCQSHRGAHHQAVIVGRVPGTLRLQLAESFCQQSKHLNVAHEFRRFRRVNWILELNNVTHNDRQTLYLAGRASRLMGSWRVLREPSAMSPGGRPGLVVT